MKLSKKELTLIAKIHAGMSLLRTDMLMFEDSSDMLEVEKEEILSQIHSIGNKLIGNHPSTLGTTEQIINYVKWNS